MLIKKIAKSVVLLSAVAVSANAVAIDFKPYVGGQLNYSKLGYSDNYKTAIKNAGIKIKDHAPGITGFVGAKLHENFGLEVGYEYNTAIKLEESTTIAGVAANVKNKANFSSFYAEAHGYLPIAEQFELIGAAGFGKVSVKNNLEAKNAATGAVIANGSHTSKVDSLKLRLGGGVKYNFDENLSARAMYRYQNLGDKGITAVHSFGLGVAYSF